MTILMYRYGSICEPDIIATFKAFRVEVAEICEEITDKKLTAGRRVELVSEGIDRYKPVFVFSINFFPAIADVCHIYRVPYFCWTVDSPVAELFSKSIQHDTNRIFLFDRAQYNDFHRFNPDCIYHLPLAAATERFDRVLTEASDQSDGQFDQMLSKASMQGADQRLPELSMISWQNTARYACDISFVGSLYSEKNPLNKIKLPEYARGYIDGIVEASLKIYGYNFVEEALSETCVKAIKESAPNFYRPENAVADSDTYVAAHMYVGHQIAETERIRTLNTLAEHFNVDLFTRSDTTPLRKVKVHGGVQTLTEMPIVFNRSRINLNMTIKPIQTGLPLRIFDILGCGGFCMTNYQEELTDHIEIGVDLEAYGSLDELVDKCAYYLDHEEQRAQIARNGYQKVKEKHGYQMRVMEMLRRVL